MIYYFVFTNILFVFLPDAISNFFNLSVQEDIYFNFACKFAFCSVNFFKYLKVVRNFESKKSAIISSIVGAALAEMATLFKLAGAIIWFGLFILAFSGKNEKSVAS